MASKIAAEIAQREIAAPAPLFSLPLATNAAEIVKRAQAVEPTPSDPLSVARQVTTLVQDPEKMQRVLESVADGLDEHAPDTAQDLRMATAKAIHFLASKAPQTKPMAPGLPDVEPTSSELNKFSKYLDAVNDPTSVLDDALSGTLGPEKLEAVKAVYPETFAQMQAELASRIADATRIPYQRRIQISALLGQDMTGTLNPRMALSAQSVYGAAPQQSSAQQQMPVYRAKGLKASGRSGAETEAWRAAQRGVGSWNKQGGR